MAESWGFHSISDQSCYFRVGSIVFERKCLKGAESKIVRADKLDLRGVHEGWPTKLIHKSA